MRLAFDVRDSWRFVLLGRDVAIEHANAKRRGASAERRVKSARIGCRANAASDARWSYEATALETSA
jgi:hypothetical protein